MPEMSYPSRDYQRFETRFYRGLSSNAAPDLASDYCKMVCPCGTVHLGLRGDLTARCFDCAQQSNEFAQKAIRMSVEAEGEDSRNPQRIAEGTSQFNIGLRGVDTVVGTHPDGTAKLSYRPIAHNELPSARARREYAKRTGCTPAAESVKRAVGGRS